MTKKNFLFKKEIDSQETLFDFLKQKVVMEKKIRFPDDLLQSYITEGFVRIDERVCERAQTAIYKGQTASIVIKIKDIKRVQKPPLVEFDLAFEDILFEDKFIIIVQKPYGVPTHPTLDPDRDNLQEALRRYLTVRDGVVPYLALHHRLDKDTSGLVLFAKNQSANKNLSELFSERKIEKTYIALTKFKKLTSPRWTVDNFLARSTKDKKKMTEVKSGGDHAITEFEVIQHNQNQMMIQARPKTGRTHQIRVHLSEFGLPILGDPFYGDGSPAERLFLHAWKLKFLHPKDQREILVESPLPAVFKKNF